MIAHKRPKGKAKGKKTKGGLLNVKGNTRPSLTKYVKEMHPNKKVTSNKISDDAVIKQRVIAINAKDLEGIAAHIETGKMLVKLEDEIEHGKWGPLFKDYKSPVFVYKPLGEPDEPEPEVQFRFGQRKAQMLMNIARVPFFADPSNYSLLPSSYNALDELAKKIPGKIPELFASGKITNESTHEEIKKVIDQVQGGTPDGLRRAIEVIITYQKTWPVPAESPLGLAAFNKEEDEWRIDIDAFANTSAWLTKLYDYLIDEYEQQYYPDDDPPVKPENPDAKPDVSPELEELQKDRKPVPENFAAFQQRKRDEQSE